VEELANAQAKEGITHSWSAGPSEKKENGGKPVGYSGWAALRKEQCDMQAHCQVTASCVNM
jgi:hypothetical protein